MNGIKSTDLQKRMTFLEPKSQKKTGPLNKMTAGNAQKNKKRKRREREQYPH
jgi:hypothetical protein